MGPTEINSKLLTWASDMETGTLLQAAKTSRLRIIEGHVALMPDAHVGMGATIGSVIPTMDTIVPSAVGVDIGCGMIAVETDILEDGLPDTLDPLHAWISSVVPSGLGAGHSDRRAATRKLTFPDHFDNKQKATSEKQLGSLGGGNHFVEVCVDERSRVWVVLHSGSRNIGKTLAESHIRIAKRDMKTAMITLEDPDLAYFVQGSPEFKAYLVDMLWAQDYALLNRDAMMDAVLYQFFGYVSSKSGDEHRDGHETRRISCHHNFAAQEEHGGHKLWITRKGAIRAQVGDLGVIPGSMATGSYIVKGLGNPLSYNSCSHGAGRRMSRSRAKKELSVESLEVWMQGKAWNAGQAAHLVDEHPEAYKDLDQVMRDQSDLVQIEHHLRTVLNYKGTK